MGYLLGLDAGTTSIKGALFSTQGEAIAQASFEYNLETPRTDFVELDPQVYWQATKEVFRKIIKSAQISSGQIKALCIDSQGETFIPVDKRGNPLRKAIVWLDNRSTQEAQTIKEKFGEEKVYHVTGQPEVVPTWPATKILWLRQKEKKVFNQVDKYFLVEDYLIYRLTGQFKTEGSLLSSSLLFDINQRKWWGEMLDFLGITPQQLPEIGEPGEIVERVSAPASKETGLSTKTVVVCGAMDQATGMVGAGNITPGIVSETTGAALAICATVDKPLFDSKRRIPCQYHAVKDKYILLPWCQTGGMALKWFRNQFYKSESERAKGSGEDVYDLMTREAAKISPGSEGLIMLPHLAGAGCPEMNSQAKGVFFGFTLGHQRAHFVHALLESIAFMLKSNIEVLEELGLKIDEVRTMGGGAKSPLWNQIKADVLGKPLLPVGAKEAACLGSAILAGKAVGIFKSWEEALQVMVSLKKKIAPNPDNYPIYQKQYEQYLKLYEALREMFK